MAPVRLPHLSAPRWLQGAPTRPDAAARLSEVLSGQGVDRDRAVVHRPPGAGRRAQACPKCAMAVKHRRSTSPSKIAPPQVRAGCSPAARRTPRGGHREDTDDHERNRDPLQSAALRRRNRPLTCGDAILGDCKRRSTESGLRPLDLAGTLPMPPDRARTKPIHALWCELSRSDTADFSPPVLRPTPHIGHLMRPDQVPHAAAITRHRRPFRSSATHPNRGGPVQGPTDDESWDVPATREVGSERIEHE